MSWHPNDLVTDADLLSYERTILTQFGVSGWEAKRKKALNDWLFPLLEANRFDPERLRTRHVPVTAWGYTSAAFSDKTAAAATRDGLNLATILASTSDYLYLGFTSPFYGVHLTMLDAASSATAALTVQAWTGGWSAVQEMADGTGIGAKTLAQGGAITWSMPESLIRRAVNGSDDLYWVRLSCSATPTGATAGPVAVIRRSRLCGPVALRTLALIFREAPIGQDGPWREKADWYEAEASKAFDRVVGQLGPEFDTDGSEAIDADEAAQTAAEVSGGGWQFERS